MIRCDSVICHDYILEGNGTLQSVVDTMVEMDWFFKHSNYRTELNAIYDQNRYLRDYDDFDKVQFSKQAKRNALKRWINQGMKGVQPPSSLNSTILQLRAR